MKMLLENIKRITSSSGLKGKIFRSGGALVSGSLAENVLRLIRNMILVRILAPDAFGIMAILMVSVQALEAFTEVGLRTSLIHNKNGSQPGFLNITWFLAAARGLALYILAFLAAPLIAVFYDKPELTDFLRVGFLVIVFHGFISPRLYILQKELRFKELVLLTQGTAIIGILVTVACGFIFQNVWALLAGFITEAVLKWLLSFIFYPIKPTLRFERAYFHDIKNFSKGMFGLPILKMLFFQIDIFVVGKVTSVEQLGIYVLIRSLATIAGTFITKIVDPILLPVLASIQDHKADFNKVFNKTIKTVAIFVFPFATTQIIFAYPLLHLVYGPTYSHFSMVFSIFSVYAVLALFYTLLSQVFFAIGQPHRHRTAALARTALFVLMIYPAAKFFGLTGAALAVSISTSAALIIQIVNIRKVMHFSLSEFTKSAITGLMLSLIIIIPGLTLLMLLQDFYFLKLAIAGLLCLMAWFAGFMLISRYPSHIPGLRIISNAAARIKTKTDHTH